MIGHLRQISAMMVPEQGRRFLSDILPEVTHPPELETLEAELRASTARQTLREDLRPWLPGI